MNQDQFMEFLQATLSVNPQVAESSTLELEMESTHGDHLHTHTVCAVLITMGNGESYMIGGTPVPFEL